MSEEEYDAYLNLVEFGINRDMFSVIQEDDEHITAEDDCILY